ncbi:MAG TPA: filamentous hemagglutinin family protein, partial [Paraburkholderia sp.]
INFGTYYQTFDGGSVFLKQDGKPDVDAFQGLGALGGGNANVSVVGNMSHVDVSSPTTGRLPTGGTSLADAVVTGGGNVNVQVGGDLSAAIVTVGQGIGTIQAGQIGDPTNNTTRLNVSPGNAQISVESDNGMNLFIGDPTRFQADPGYTGNGGTASAALWQGLLGCDSCTAQQPNPTAPFAEFTTYTDATSISAYAGGGNIVVRGDYIPANVSLSAADGSIYGITSFELLALPSPTAQIDVLASQSINDLAIGMDGEGSVTTLDYAPDYYLAQTVTSPTQVAAATVAPVPIVQTGDPQSAHIYAVDGSINTVTFYSTEQSDIRAGLDILNPKFEIQNNNPTDVSLIQAGRDILNDEGTSSLDVFSIRVGGPGDVLVDAGRNLEVYNQNAQSIGYGLGIDTVGNADNSLLPRTGASITVMAGIGQNGPDLSAFENAYLDPSGSLQGGSAYLQQLEQWLASRGVDGSAPLTADQAYTALEALPAAQQLLFVEQVYFNELKVGGEAEAAGLGAGGNGYDRAYRAIEALFPGSEPGDTTTGYNGSISVYGQGAIRSDAGGDLNVLVPGGSLTLGFENDTPDLTGEKDTARPGLLTLRGGDINTFTDGDVVVAQSRVFTELGGNILMFSDNGDLNAGKGKVTSLVTSPPQFTMDAYGNVTKSPVTPETGAGIATLTAIPGALPGDVDLYAPHGTIDAGEAGIRVSGNLSIAALQVLNTQNIQVQGKQTGLQPAATVDTVALTAAAAATSAISDIAQNLVKSTASSVSSRHWVISVQVEGFGDSDDDGKSKKRKATPVAYNPASQVSLLGFGPVGKTQRGFLTKEEQDKLGGI